MSEGIWMKKTLVAAVAAGTLVLAGCNSDDTTDPKATNNTENTTTNPDNFASVNNPRGSITGLVTDTNGNPIEGARVYLGNQSVTTNIGGQYYFDEVAVTQTVKNDTDSYSQALALTIVPPAGYLKATVTVTPQAQIFNGNDGSDNSVENPITTFIDGFNASAGTAVLPALTATVNGVLRNEATGEPLGSVSLALDMTGTETGTAQEQAQDGVNTSYGTGRYTAVTNADGSFTFSNVPADSKLVLSANGYTLKDTTPAADTSSEDTAFEFKTVKALPVLSEDLIAPWVESVAQVVDQTSTRAMLDDDTDRVITVVFSETMDASRFDDNSLRVRDVDAGEYLEHTASLSGNTLTITILESKDGNPQEGLLARAGNSIDILLLKDDLRDTGSPASGLGIKDGDDDSAIKYDHAHGTSAGGTYVRLELTAFAETNMDAEQVTLDATSQQSEDLRGANDLDVLQASNDAFLDIDDLTVGIQQLNAADDDDGSVNPDAQERMQALAGALAGTIGSLESTAVNANTAGIEFAATNASKYELDVLSGNTGLSKFEVLARVELDGGTLTGQEFTADVAVGSNLYLVIQGVEPGDIVQVTPYDEFGYAGNSSSVALVDNVAPTTVLQNAYGVGAKNNNGSVTSLQYGDGGEQSSLSNVEIGTPILNVTPRMLSIVDGTADGTDEYGLEGIYTLKPLFDLNTVSDIDGDANQGELFIDELNFLSGNIAGSTPGVYDAVAYSNWTLGSRTVGVAFSEDLAEGSFVAANVGETEISATLADYSVNNDVQRQDENGATYADLIQFSVDNVLTFGNVDHAGVIDFSAAIEDVAGNAGASNAKVVIGDALPPLVKSAVYSGSELTITFNEPVTVDTSTVISLGNLDITLDQDTVDAFIEAKTPTVLKVLPSTWGDDLNRTGIFTLAQYDEAKPDDGSFPGGKFLHGRLDFSDVEDLNGNSWSDFSTGATATSEEFFFHQPDFAAIDVTGQFSVTGADNGTVLNSGAVSVRFTGTHPIDISDWDANLDGNVSQNEFENKFTFTDASGGGVTIDIADDTHTINSSNGGKTLTFTFVLSGNVEAGDNLEVNTPWESQWDSSETSAPANSDVDFN